MCGCDNDEATSCCNRGEGAPCSCLCHGHQEATPATRAGSLRVRHFVHRVKVQAFDASGTVVYELDGVDPGPPGYLRFNVAHTQPEPGATLTALAIDILEREPMR